MSEAHTTIEKLLRPAWNFEVDYASNLSNGMPAVGGDVPILFTYPHAPRPPLGKADTLTSLDPEASMVLPPIGISPLLARFVPCAIGQTQVFYFPVVPKWGLFDRDGSPGEFCYVWRVVWRMRSIADYVRRKQDRLPYTVAKEAVGAPDVRWPGEFPLPDRPNTLVSQAGTANIAGKRLVKPGVMESAIYARSVPDPTQETTPFYGMLMPDAVAIPCTVGMLNKTARYPGTGLHFLDYPDEIPTLDMQQGIFTAGPITPETPTGYPSTAPMYMSKAVRCNGNEYAVECFKYNYNQGMPDFNSPRDWDFEVDPNYQCTGGEDYFFSLLFGIGNETRSPQAQPVGIDCGVRVVAGIMDS